MSALFWWDLDVLCSVVQMLTMETHVWMDALYVINTCLSKGAFLACYCFSVCYLISKNRCKLLINNLLKKTNVHVCKIIV